MGTINITKEEFHHLQYETFLLRPYPTRLWHSVTLPDLSVYLILWVCLSPPSLSHLHSVSFSFPTVPAPSSTVFTLLKLNTGRLLFNFWSLLRSKKMLSCNVTLIHSVYAYGYTYNICLLTKNNAS